MLRPFAPPLGTTDVVRLDLLGTVETLSGKSKAMDRHSIECLKRSLFYHRAITGRDSVNSLMAQKKLEHRRELQRTVDRDMERLGRS